MPRFIIKASEETFYQEEVEAKTTDEAIEKCYLLMQNGDIDPCDTDGFTIDKVEEEDDD